MKTALTIPRHPGSFLNHGAMWVWLVLCPMVQAAKVNVIETAVNDVDGSTIAAVSLNQFVEIGTAYTTGTAPVTWSSYRFTHWTYSGEPGTVYRDAWGRSKNPISFVLAVASTATAHYLPTARDSEPDGVPDWYEMEFFGDLTRAVGDDGDGDGITLLAEYTAGSSPIYANNSQEGGVAWADSSLVTCNLAGYPTYTLRSDPAGTVNQSAVVVPGTVVTVAMATTCRMPTSNAITEICRTMAARIRMGTGSRFWQNTRRAARRSILTILRTAAWRGRTRRW